MAGLHRLEAFKRLGRSHIWANIISDDELDRIIQEVDENLTRQNYNHLEAIMALTKRQEAYQAKYRETKRGVAGGVASGRARQKHSDLTSANYSVVPSFAEDTAKKVGVHPRTVGIQVQAG